MFTLTPQGSFSLAQSKAFLQGFTPARGTSNADDVDGDGFSLSFLLDKTWTPCAVRLSQRADGVVEGVVSAGVDEDRARAQVARVLGLDVDGRGYDVVCANDPVLAPIAAAWPGFRPVSFSTPWEAGVWGLLTQRISMPQAAALRKKIALAHGTSVVVGGEALQVFPSPAAFLSIGPKDVPAGIPEEKWTRLRGFAEVAVAGGLDVDVLRALPFDDAVARLLTIRGVGPWTAQHIALRGTGSVDALALSEPRVRAAIAHAAQLPDVDDAQAARLSDAWRPFRTWALVLVVLHLSRTGNWNVDRSKKHKASTTKKKQAAPRKQMTMM